MTSTPCTKRCLAVKATLQALPSGKMRWHMELVLSKSPTVSLAQRKWSATNWRRPDGIWYFRRIQPQRDRNAMRSCSRRQWADAYMADAPQGWIDLKAISTSGNKGQHTAKKHYSFDNVLPNHIGSATPSLSAMLSMTRILSTALPSL